MRLDVSMLGVLACSVGLGAAEDDDLRTGGATGTATTESLPAANSIIIFGALPTPAVYRQDSGNQTIPYHWGEGIRELDVRAVYLRRYGDDVTIAEGDINKTTSTGTSFAPQSEGDILERRQPPLSLPPFHFAVNQENITLMTRDGLSDYRTNIGQPLYYEIQWENSTSKGSSYSQYLAVSTNEGYFDASATLQTLGMGTNPAKPESFPSSSSNPESTTVSSTPSSTDTSAQPVAQASSGGGGLNTGAIAGIAVGCSVAGLLIIAFIVWFLFFRRRSSRDQVRGADYAAGSGTHAIVSEKEAAGITESSPRSLYGDDGGRLRDPRGSMTQPDDIASYAPYSDRGRSPSPPAAGAAFGTGSQSNVAPSATGHDNASTTRSPTPPFASRYAHLIEEGMTEEEIRRLEEEERHLDAAIEDAGRNSRMTHQP
ncbi:hypothetical protein AAE478_002584 [Parahypoxylon ruwenzoriense]